MHTGGSVLFTNEKIQKHNQLKWLWLVCTSICNRFVPWYKPSDTIIWPRKDAYTLCGLPQLTGDGSFPKTTRRVPYHVHNSKTIVDIFCVCRMPNDNQEYLHCFQCNGWYHPTCVDIPNWVINSKRRWRCYTCRGKNARKANFHKSTKNNLH